MRSVLTIAGLLLAVGLAGLATLAAFLAAVGDDPSAEHGADAVWSAAAAVVALAGTVLVWHRPWAAFVGFLAAGVLVAFAADMGVFRDLAVVAAVALAVAAGGWVVRVRSGRGTGGEGAGG
jgi:hypothetical protein